MAELGFACILYWFTEQQGQKQETHCAAEASCCQVIPLSSTLSLQYLDGKQGGETGKQSEESPNVVQHVHCSDLGPFAKAHRSQETSCSPHCCKASHNYHWWYLWIK